MGENTTSVEHGSLSRSHCESGSRRGEVIMPRRRDHLRVVQPLSPSERAVAEYTKDSWNAEHLVGVKYSDASSNRWIHFGGIPEQFRPLAKQWCQFLLA